MTLEIGRTLLDQTARLPIVLGTRCFAGRMGEDCRGRPPRPGQRGTGIAARGLEQREDVEGHGNIGVFRTKDLLAERKRALIQRLRLVVAALGPIAHRPAH